MLIALSNVEHDFLERAVRLGRRGWGQVHPNPMVGCVLVREGRIVGEGYHEEYGSAHAEVNALSAAVAAGESPAGTTAFVSLEPCSHRGKTGPCTLALRDAGVRRVVFGAPDPGRDSGGGGVALEGFGIEVVGPVFSQLRARRENPVFFHNQERKETFVAVKLALTLDGKIAEAPGRRTRISGPEAWEEGQSLRAGFASVMVGGRTARIDDPLLTVRAGLPPRVPPTRIVLDPEAGLSPDAALFHDIERAPLLVFVGQGTDEGRVYVLEKCGATVVPVPRGARGLDLQAVLDACWARGIFSIFCEGGGTLASALLDAGRVGRLYLLVTPDVLGPDAVPAFPERFGAGAWEGWQPVEARPCGRDVLMTFDRES